jgi:hypothetical protein
MQREASQTPRDLTQSLRSGMGDGTLWNNGVLWTKDHALHTRPTTSPEANIAYRAYL